ncbi:hypothetical protein SAMN06264364_12056 [Quadrisphaera granulorum]|uniref:Uncharacterized protein n=1 Tax=Quadrisphaera granulorum TaxID=317664 RepID=A0A316A3B7_9ACTN|nr:hypothetical protein BXY45_12056 [Quadrisphaera granulorum]SZE97725.1 hypothetical protein SAMN06264364_12056 [Quadrisphaera granulorum]
MTGTPTWRWSRALAFATPGPRPPADDAMDAELRTRRMPPAHLGIAYQNVFVETAVLEVISSPISPRDAPTLVTSDAARRTHRTADLVTTDTAPPAVGEALGPSSPSERASSPIEKPSLSVAVPEACARWSEASAALLAALMLLIAAGMLTAFAIALTT